MKFRLSLTLLLLAICGVGLSFFLTRHDPYEHPIYALLPSSNNNQQGTAPEASTVSIQAPLPPRALIATNYHIFQTFNNCGPATLSMLLSYYGIHISQKALAEEMRPYQHPQGDNDDKSVTFAEMAAKAKTYGLVTYHRPAGSMELLKRLIANDIPVITKTWLKADDDIGHYRIVKGYDDEQKKVMQDDSYQGKNLTYAYEAFTDIWGKFNDEYLVIVPKNKVPTVEEILGPYTDETYAWKMSEERARQQLNIDSENLTARFNLVVALTHLEQYEEAVKEFERVENRLPSRTLWYQIEPIEAYAALGNDARVLTLTEKILTNGNRAFSELYLTRAEIFKRQGNMSKEREEIEKAILYNKNLPAAKKALQILNESNG